MSRNDQLRESELALLFGGASFTVSAQQTQPRSGLPGEPQNQPGQPGRSEPCTCLPPFQGHDVDNGDLV